MTLLPLLGEAKIVPLESIFATMLHATIAISLPSNTPPPRWSKRPSESSSQSGDVVLQGPLEQSEVLEWTASSGPSAPRLFMTCGIAASSASAATDAKKRTEASATACATVCAIATPSDAREGVNHFER